MSGNPPKFDLTEVQKEARKRLNGLATHISLYGGSRSGKTFLIIRNIIIRALKAPNTHHAIFRFRLNSIKASIIFGTLPKVMALCFPELTDWRKGLNKTDWFLTLPNGSEIWFGGLDSNERTEKILGNEYSTIYFNETSQIPWESRVLAISRLAELSPLKLKAYYDLNPSAKTHWTYRLFFEKKDPESKQPLSRPENYDHFQINPISNVHNLAENYLDELNDLPEKAKKRFLYGEYSDDNDMALWNDTILSKNRVLGKEGTLPDWLRVIVAVDPSGSKGVDDYRSDEIGIAVVALGTDGHGYLLEDLSGRYSPEEWGNVVASAYERHKADRVVGEKNFGGDMVRAIVHSVDSQIPYQEVHASRGKVARAEPISSLYEQGKIHHVGYFPEVEDQMCFFMPHGYQGLKSPDRADAVIWGFTELFPKMTKREDRNWKPPKVIDIGHDRFKR